MDDEETDWPAVITRLRRQVQSRVGVSYNRQQLAVALNNYGVELSKDGQLELAKVQLREAIEVDPANDHFPVNLAGVYLREAAGYYERHQAKQAKAAVEEALALNPDSAEAFALLGELEYNQQHLAKAQGAWQRAVELNPNLDQVTERLRRLNEEIPIESSFGRITQAYFDLRYEDQLERPRGFDIRDALLRARREVGSDFAYWPKYRIVVLIYGAASFRALRAETPEWVAGQYDGKIRVPLPNQRLGTETVEQIIFHEYAHALVHDVARGKCPRWFDEGIAEYEGRRRGSAQLQELARAEASGSLVPWFELTDQFSPSLPVREVTLGYQQSYSIVAYLVERYGFWRIRRILKALGEGDELQELLGKEFRVSLDRLQKNWRAWLPKILEPTS